MTTAAEIVIKAKVYAESIGNEDGTSAYDYVMGYNQCQQDMVDKKYTEEDLLHAFREGVLLPNSQIGIMEDIFKQVVHSLNKQDK
jgi:hypothetical protein